MGGYHSASVGVTGWGELKGINEQMKLIALVSGRAGLIEARTY